MQFLSGAYDLHSMGVLTELTLPGISSHWPSNQLVQLKACTTVFSLLFLGAAAASLFSSFNQLLILNSFSLAGCLVSLDSLLFIFATY